MEVSMEPFSVVLSVVLVSIVACAWRVLNWVWLRPKNLEKCLRRQGLAGNSYRLWSGDLRESSIMLKEAMSKPMNLSHNTAPRVLPFVHQSVSTYGKNSFMWIGPTPRVNITNPEDLKDIFTKHEDFPKPALNPLVKLLGTGLANYEGEKWAKHRRIVNPAFHSEKLKRMLPAFYQSCSAMIDEWESLVSKDSSCELDVWPYLQNVTADVISRTSFGSSYKEGREIFQLLKVQAELTIKTIQSVYRMEDKATERVLFHGACNNGLYPIPSFLPNQSASNSKLKACLGKLVNSTLWHNRLSHPSNSVSSTMLKKSNIVTIHDTPSTLCQSCLEGNLASYPFIMFNQICGSF